MSFHVIRPRHRHAIATMLQTVIVIVTALVLTACTTNTSQRKQSNSTTTRTQDTSTAPSGQPTAHSDGGALAIGPLAADELGYRVDWRTATGVRNVRHFSMQHDSVYIVDGSNFLSRIRSDDGVRLWRTPVADPVEDILDVVDFPDDGLVLVVTPGIIMELDRASGGQTGRQKLAKIARTKPVVAGQFLIYGARNGQVIWHSYPVKFQWRATQLARTISVPPVLADGIVAVVGNNGEIMVLSAQHARSIWSDRLLDEVVAAPAISNGVLYVAGLDQHLRALDIRNGRSQWKVLTKAPLRDSPVVLDNRLYQQIPGTGLVCFDALPLDSPGGKIIWTAAEVTGSVLTQRGSDLICWDAQKREIQILDSTYGTLKQTMNLHAARKIVCTSTSNGTIYVVSDSGTITRLVMKN